MVQHDFEWKQDEEFGSWELFMDGLVVYFLVRADDQGRMWGALDNCEGAVPALIGLRWLHIDDAKSHVLKVAHDRYGKVPLLAPDYVAHSHVEPLTDEEIREETETMFRPEKPKTLAEAFTLRTTLSKG